MKRGAQPPIERLAAAARTSLAAYESFLAEFALPHGFVARTDARDLHERHIVDSLRVLECLGSRPLGIADLGSGAGLPGIPVAIARRDCQVTLVEPQARRVAFLELVIESLRLPNVRILRARAGSADLEVDAAIARALASPARSWALAQPHLRPGGCLLYFAGRSWRSADQPPAEEVESTICAPASFPGQGPVVRMRLRPT